MKYILIGLFCGFINGLLGGGAGLVTLPLIRNTMTDKKDANAYTLSAVLAASAVSTIIYYYNGNIDLSVSREYIIGGIISVPIGVMLLKKSNTLFLKKAFAVFLIFCGLRMLYA